MKIPSQAIWNYLIHVISLVRRIALGRREEWEGRSGFAIDPIPLSAFHGVEGDLSEDHRIKPSRELKNGHVHMFTLVSKFSVSYKFYFDLQQQRENY